MSSQQPPPGDPFTRVLSPLLAAALEVAEDLVAPHIRPAADPAHGDYALPCFPLARQARRNPAELAQAGASRIAPGAGDGLVVRAEARGPYLNLFLDPAAASRLVVSEVLRSGARYGAAPEGSGHTIVIDYSSPNIAKPLAFHHLRSTMIGNALVRLLRFQGHHVVGCNFLGDWGLSFAKLMVAMDRYGVTEADLQEGAVATMAELYVRFNQEAEEQPALEDEAREVFARLEAGDPVLRQRWEHIRAASLAEFQELYGRLGVSFEDYTGEAAYDRTRQEAVIRRLEEAGLTSVDDEGRLVVDLREAGVKVPCILRKSDGSSLYATRDLAAIFDRQERFHFQEALYVVDMGQSLHFRQWFTVVKLLSEPWAEGLQHLAFGVVVGASGTKHRSRKGGAALLADVLDEAVRRVREIIARSPTTELQNAEDIDAVAEQIGVGAVIFNDLKTARVKDVRFDLDDVVSLDGFTAPYIQCAHARICGIFRKAGAGDEPPPDAPLERLVHPREQALVRALSRFAGMVARAASEHEPSVLAQYLHELAGELSRFYHDCRVISADRPLMAARLGLVAAVRQVLATGLGLLGIQAPRQV